VARKEAHQLGTGKKERVNKSVIFDLSEFPVHHLNSRSFRRLHFTSKPASAHSKLIILVHTTIIISEFYRSNFFRRHNSGHTMDARRK